MAKTLPNFPRGAKLTPVQAAILFHKHWKNWDQVKNALQIAMREGGLDWSAKNLTGLDRSYGSFQLNFYGGQKADFSPERAMDPEQSTAYSHRLFQKYGWDPWISPSYGRGPEFADDAAAAVARARKMLASGKVVPNVNNNETPDNIPTQFGGQFDSSKLAGAYLLQRLRAYRTGQEGPSLLDLAMAMRQSGKDGGMFQEGSQPAVRATSNAAEAVHAEAQLQLPRSFSITHDTDGLAGYPAHDFMADPGTSVGAPAAGIITRFSGSNKWKSGGIGGRSIYLKTKKGIYFLTHFAPNLLVKVGQRVKKGQILGYVGDPTSGMAPHIHAGFNDY